MSALRRPLLACLAVLACVALAGCGRDPASLRAEIGSSPVVLLSTAWCGYCRKLRSDLADWGVSYEEFDVESSTAGRNAYGIVGGRGVPILLVGDEVVHGYSPQRARELIAAAGLGAASP